MALESPRQALIYSSSAMTAHGGPDVLSFLFADLESSTRLWETHPDAMKPALERHDTILREAVESSGGRVVKATGDGLMAAFTSASDGASCCLEAQQRLGDEPWGETGPLRVRMGMHAGEAQERGGDYFGPPVYRAARIMSAAHGGQVLLSEVAAQLAGGGLPPHAALRDLGEHRLKDLLQPERIFQLVHPRLSTDFPPLTTLDRRPHNLPTQISDFLGRAAELDAIRELLLTPGVRLLTLTGAGGIGKTRLALQAGADHIDGFRDGLYFVDLSPVRAPTAAFDAIVRAVGVTGTSQQGPLELLKQQLRTTQMLLILDNFEQVMDAADGVGELLRGCPELKVLVTSREALRLRGEQLFPVPPLSVPHDGAAQTAAEALARYEAVRLFVERAREVRPSFALTDDNVAPVAEICARLDGLPLAIELAVARLKLFSPDELRRRLQDRLGLLRGGARDLPARQQTLRSTIEWSYELLDADERAVFCVLSVFSSTRAEAVEEIVARIPGLGHIDAIERLESLTDKSLVRSTESSGSVRMSMLETIREYAAERLDEEPGFRRAARHAHAQYYSELVGAMRDRLYGPRRRDALDDLAAEIGNLRTAWGYWVAAGDFEELNKLVDGLWALYDARGWYHAAVELTKDLLDVLGAAPPTPDRARHEIALRTSLARGLLAIRGYTEEVEQAYSSALELLREAGELPQRVQVLRSLASFHLYRAEFDKAAAIGRELLDVASEQDDDALRVEGHLLLGSNLAFLGDVPGGLEHLDRAIALFDPHRHGTGRFRLGPSPGVVPHTTSAFLLWQRGHPERALQHAARGLALAKQLDHPFTLAYALFHVGLLDLWRREITLVRERASGVLQVAQEHDYQVWRAVALVLHGVATTGLGRPEKGLDETARGIALYQDLKTPPIFWPVLLSLRARALGLGHQPAEGIAVIDAALEMTGGHDMLYPEFALLKGDLLAATSDLDGAEGLFHDAFDVAGKWEARMLMLQAATRLTRLGRGGATRPDAAERLRTVYETFTEGFETRDLVEARALVADPPRDV